MTVGKHFHLFFSRVGRNVHGGEIEVRDHGEPILYVPSKS